MAAAQDMNFATPEGQMVPFEAYNLFYPDGKRDTLEHIPKQLRQQHVGRKHWPIKPQRR